MVIKWILCSCKGGCCHLAIFPKPWLKHVKGKMSNGEGEAILAFWFTTIWLFKKQEGYLATLVPNQLSTVFEKKHWRRKKGSVLFPKLSICQQFIFFITSRYKQAYEQCICTDFILCIYIYMKGRCRSGNPRFSASSSRSAAVSGNPRANLSFLGTDICNCWPKVTSILSSHDLADCLDSA